MDAPAHDDEQVLVQCSAHGDPVAATVRSGGTRLEFHQPTHRVAPGQSVVMYRNDLVIGGGIAQQRR